MKIAVTASFPDLDGSEFTEAGGPDVPSHHGMGMRPAAAGCGTTPGSPRTELESLEKRSRDLQKHLDRINERIAALEKKGQYEHDG